MTTSRPATARSVIAAVLGFGLLGPAWADDAPGSSAEPLRPQIRFERWQGDWVLLTDPELRTEPLDNLKYIPLSSDDPRSYLSLGLNLRDRIESTQVASFGIGNPDSNTYVIQRLEFHADLHPSANWQVFVQLQDDRAFR